MQTREDELVFSGEVELYLSPRLDLAAVSELSKYLEAETDVEVIRTSGSWDQGMAITLLLQKPLPLIKTLSNIPLWGESLMLTVDDALMAGDLSLKGNTPAPAKRIMISSRK